jgi:hypothetical protein
MFADPISFPRYLAAKRSVDDRALNRLVWDALVACLPLSPRPLRVLEIGAGIGTMFQRMVEWKGLSNAEYTAIDSQAENTRFAHTHLPVWAAAQGLEIVGAAERLSFSASGRAYVLNLETVDVFDFLERVPRAQRWDLLVANAFLDLVDAPQMLSRLVRLLEPGGLLYLTINFDGVTILEPTVDVRLDEKILLLFHQSMDQRLVNGRKSGDSRTGRHLFTWLRQAGLEILAAGSADWAVYPRQGEYPEDEAYFLHFILHFFEDTLTNSPELAGEPFQEWLAARRRQIEQGELVYIAHQMDFLAAAPG